MKVLVGAAQRSRYDRYQQEIDIAQEVARRARCFAMKILCTKRTPLSPESENEFGVTYVDPPTLLGAADFVSLHATQIGDEGPIIGAEELAMMNIEAFFKNGDVAGLR